MNTLKPFIPDQGRPWDRRRAAHLLRRAGFCPSSTEVQAALALGPSRTVARLVRADRDSDTYDEIDRMGERIALGASGDTDRLRQWWVLRACRTERPLHCRMALFDRYVLCQLSEVLRCCAGKPSTESAWSC